MKHRFLLHLLSHTVLVIDISEIGITVEMSPKTSNTKRVPTLLRFPAWKEAEQYLRAKRADSESVEDAFGTLKKTSLAVLTIV